MKRRAFIAGLGSAAAWPLVARGQQNERMRRIGMLFASNPDDAEFQTWIRAFLKALAGSGWTVGHNVHIDTRWANNADAVRRAAADLAALAPDVILAHGSPTAGPLQRAIRTVPIVFVSVVDPVAIGLVDSLARPGGNVTGFLNFEFSLSGKWPELLKQIAPGTTRMAVLRDPAVGTSTSQFAVIQAGASPLRVEVNPINMRDAAEIEHSIETFARSPNGGLIVTGGPAQHDHRHLIIALAAKHRLPAIYPYQFLVAAGGLASYGPDFIDQYRRAAGYVDRILKGEKPADLPVQMPTKYELVINLKTAKALDLTVPPTLLARADEVIE